MTVGGPRLRRWGLAAAAGAALVLSGCAGPPATVPPSLPVIPGGAVGAAVPLEPETGEPIVESEVLALVAGLDDALRSGDAEQWLDHFALPDEQDLQQQRDWFAGVQAVPMDVREIHATHVAGHSSATRLGPLVDLAFRHQVSGADPLPAVEEYRVRLGRRAGEVRVVDVAPVRAATTGYPQPWDLGPIEVVESGAVLVLAEQDLAEDVEEMLPALDDAASAVLADFPQVGVERMVVTVTAPKAFDEIVAETGAEFAGVAQALYTVEGVVDSDGLAVLEPGDTLAVRLHLDAEYVREEWDFYGSELTAGSPLLRHEALHLAMTMLEPGALPPAWAAEGFAGWYEVSGDAVLREDHLWWLAEVIGGEAPDGLPPRLPRTFYSADEDEITRNYAEAAGVFLYVEDTYGREAAVELGLALNAIGDPTDDPDRLLREHLGVGAEEFEQGWIAWAGELD